MNPLIVPKKYQRSGLKVFCSNCNRQVSKSCGKTKKGISTCQFPEKHKYKAVVHIPLSDYKRKTKLLTSRIVEDAINEMVEFKQKLKEANYQLNHNYYSQQKTKLLIELCQDYLDFIEGVNTPEHLKRKRNELHKKEIARVLLRFNTSLKLKGYNINSLKIDRIGDYEVGIFHTYLLEELNLGRATYNRHIIVVRGFYKWLKNHKGFTLIDPFSKIELRKPITVARVITNQEYKALILAITKENGLLEGESEKRNRYKKYLVNAFHLALQTGCRREEIALLKWNNIVELEQGVEVLKIENLKVNRIMTGEDGGEYQRFIPITKSLKSLLISMGYDEKKGTNQFIIDRPKDMEITYFMDTLSRGFSHYFKLVSDRGLQFKDLRKTYITRITEKLGTSAKIFTGHSSDTILKNHYIASEYTAAKLNDLELFRN